MAHVIKDRVAESWTGTGAGTITASGSALGASFRTLTSVLANGDTFPYLIVHQTAAEWETGTGTWNGTGFTRSVKQSSNSDAAVNFSSGTKEIRLGPSSSDVKPIGSVTQETVIDSGDQLLGWDAASAAARLYPVALIQGLIQARWMCLQGN